MNVALQRERSRGMGYLRGAGFECFAVESFAACGVKTFESCRVVVQLLSTMLQSANAGSTGVIHLHDDCGPGRIPVLTTGSAAQWFGNGGVSKLFCMGLKL